MKNSYQERLNHRLEAILAFLPLNSNTLLQAFVRQFYAKMPVVELERMDPAQAAAIAASASAFMADRQAGEPKIRIFTPGMREHGYESRRLVVELINDDMPFLVDSLSAELSRLGYIIHETIHPIFRIVRARGSLLQSVSAPLDKKSAAKAVKGETNESFIHFELSAPPVGTSPEATHASLQRVLVAVKAAVTDWHAIEERVEKLEKELEKASGEEVAEARAFLAWLRDRNFVFLGWHEEGKALGACKIEGPAAPIDRSVSLLSITKSDTPSLVHRPVLMDVITLKRPKGGICQLAGLFTSAVYYQSAEAIPVVRHKMARVLARSDYTPASHDGKAMRAILEFFPRDEMFQYGEEALFETALGILALEAKPNVRLFVRHDMSERFVSAMVFIPREHFSTDLRKTIIQTLEEAFQGRVETFNTQMTESALARLHVLIRTTPGFIPEVDVAAVEAEIARYTHLWADQLHEELIAHFGEHEAEPLFRRFGSAFPQAYISRYNISATIYDIQKSHEALESGGLSLDLYRDKRDLGALHLKIYNPSEEIALSDILPMLENMGFRAIDEHPFLVTPQGAPPIWIRDVRLMPVAGLEVTLEHIKPVFEEALLKVWRGEMKNDRFNALVPKCGLDWRQVTMLRAYAKYLRQIGFAYGQPVLEQTLIAYPQAVRTLSTLFLARFDPAADGAREAFLVEQMEEQIAQAANLADDRILRMMLTLIRATLRTNYFQRDAKGGFKPVLSFKFDSHEVPGIPKPVPYAEIFVYGMRVEGIHLRGGKVARGGIRWSDRPEDFRTEILGLMKAQMVKNSVIVPVGSKGGFVVKQPPANVTREAAQEEGIACYTQFLHGLLDLTDNIVSGAVVPPPQVRRHDGDDPYLVVAADKGTASFSDIANGVSRAYGFWLDDAFASGGSAGYDHKKMGITARGGWVSVTRHFREMGRDIAQESFTAAGIGDMSGDVFGNGMLLADTMRLVAAFNHQHIFLDPDPDPKTSFAERQRLFNLPRSSWKDYDAALISKGGGIYERSAKTVSLSAEAMAALGITAPTMAPDELIRAILCAPVDLLWNGGIGTYVKAEEETHDQVGDRTNNAVRVNGKELRCKVVGEGGNLGFTQRGRIEYARSGGRINTDAIDNSGGVDCSDHEVNIKIAFAAALSAATLTREARDTLLVEMTDEVARLVLKDNFLQTQAVSLSEQQGVVLLEPQARLMRRLEKQGLLDRGVEFLPSDRQIAALATAGKGLTRPEIAVLLAYSKIALYRDIIDSTLPDEPYFSSDLARYFPVPMQQRFMAELEAHPLKREIIATVATNSLVNRMGITFFFDIASDTGHSTREIAAAYTVARDAFGLRNYWSQIERLSGSVDNGLQLGMLLSINRLVERVTRWALQHLPQPIAIEAHMASLKPGVEEFYHQRADMHSSHTRKAESEVKTALMAADVPVLLAEYIAALPMLSSACDILSVAHRAGTPVKQAGAAYFHASEQLGFDELRGIARSLATASHWDRLAIQAVVEELYDEQRRLTASILAFGESAVPEDGYKRWAEAYQAPLGRYISLLDELRTGSGATLSALLVATRQLKAVE